MVLNRLCSSAFSLNRKWKKLNSNISRLHFQFNCFCIVIICLAADCRHKVYKRENYYSNHCQRLVALERDRQTYFPYSFFVFFACFKLKYVKGNQQHQRTIIGNRCSATKIIICVYGHLFFTPGVYDVHRNNKIKSIKRTKTACLMFNVR